MKLTWENDETKTYSLNFQFNHNKDYSNFLQANAPFKTDSMAWNVSIKTVIYLQNK